MKTATVSDVAIPALGLGTWQTTGDQCYETVSTALELGYRHVDTAQMYGNEPAVGRAIADSDVWVTTKVTPGNACHDDVLESTRESLERLDTSYVALLLLHWPNPLVDFRNTARAMAELRDDGLIRHAGVSNFRRWRPDSGDRFSGQAGRIRTSTSSTSRGNVSLARPSRLEVQT